VHTQSGNEKMLSFSYYCSLQFWPGSSPSTEYDMYAHRDKILDVSFVFCSWFNILINAFQFYS
jgi:hypothetical protein